MKVKRNIIHVRTKKSKKTTIIFNQKKGKKEEEKNPLEIISVCHDKIKFVKPFMKGDKFLTFINYAGKVTQILYHQFTWVNSQTDWSVISHLSRLRTTHFLRQYLKKKRFWDSFCPNEDKFNLTLFLLRALFFLPFFF